MIKNDLPAGKFSIFLHFFLLKICYFEKMLYFCIVIKIKKVMNNSFYRRFNSLLKFAKASVKRFPSNDYFLGYLDALFVVKRMLNSNSDKCHEIY